MYKKCVDCKKMFPEHLVEDYPQVFKTPVCPICALKILNTLRNKPPGTPFDNQQSQEDLEEVRVFISFQNKDPWGGHMINPPGECPYRFVDKDGGGHWVDNGNCNITCKDLCVRYYQFSRMTPDERKDELIENGVKLP
jgi:DNA-directed RNA polymerase subunit RPC12/RpoP